MNNVTNSTSFEPVYNYPGVFMYTMVTFIFYAFALFYTLMIHTDPDDHYYEKKWAVYKESKIQRNDDINQENILNSLSDLALREKYWRIYYGDDGYKSPSNKFLSAETKRLSIVSQRKKELNDQQLKTSNRHVELDELDRISSKKVGLSQQRSNLLAPPKISPLRRLSLAAPILMIPENNEMLQSS